MITDGIIRFSVEDDILYGITNREVAAMKAGVALWWLRHV